MGPRSGSVRAHAQLRDEPTDQLDPQQVDPPGRQGRHLFGPAGLHSRQEDTPVRIAGGQELGVRQPQIALGGRRVAETCVVERDLGPEVQVCIGDDARAMAMTAVGGQDASYAVLHWGVVVRRSR